MSKQANHMKWIPKQGVVECSHCGGVMSWGYLYCGFCGYEADNPAYDESLDDEDEE